MGAQQERRTIFLQALTNPTRTTQSGIRQERRILWTRCVSVLCATRETNDIFLQALTNPCGHRSLEYGRNEEWSYAQQERRMTFFYKLSLTLYGHRSLEYDRNDEYS